MQGPTSADRTRDPEEEEEEVEVDDATVLRTLGESAEHLEPDLRMAWFKTVRILKGVAYDGPTQRRAFSESNQAQAQAQARPGVPGPPEGLNARYLRPAALPPPRLEGTPSQIRAMGAAPLMGVAYDADPTFDPNVTEYIDRHHRTINSTNEPTQIPYWKQGPSRTIDQRLMMGRDDPDDFPVPPLQGDELVTGASGGGGGVGNPERSSETMQRYSAGWDELDRSLDHPGSGAATRDDYSLVDEEVRTTRPATADGANVRTQTQARTQGVSSSSNVPHGRPYLTHRHPRRLGFGPDLRREPADHSRAQGSNTSANDARHLRHYVTPHRQQESGSGPDSRIGLGNVPRTGQGGDGGGNSSQARGARQLFFFLFFLSFFLSFPIIRPSCLVLTRFDSAAGFWQGSASASASGPESKGRGSQVVTMMETSRCHSSQISPSHLRGRPFWPAFNPDRQWGRGSVPDTDPASSVWFDGRPPLSSSSQVAENSSRQFRDHRFHPAGRPLRHPLPHRSAATTAVAARPAGRGGHDGRGRGRGGHGHDGRGHGRGGHGHGHGGHGLGHERGGEGSDGSARPGGPGQTPPPATPVLVPDEHGHMVSRNLLEYRDEAEKDPFEGHW